MSTQTVGMETTSNGELNLPFWQLICALVCASICQIFILPEITGKFDLRVGLRMVEEAQRKPN